MKLDEIINELINNINNIWDLYISLNQEWKNQQKFKINFSSEKKRIDWLCVNKNSEEYEMINDYEIFLKNNQIRIFENNKKFNNSYRIKNKKSIKNKINRYCNSFEKGKVILKKCLNDLLGFRTLIKYNNKEILLRKLNEINGIAFKKVCIHDRNGEYKAIHIYFQESNNSFIWELQIWLENDKKNNENQHIIKYGKA